MRLYAWGFFAVTLMVFGQSDRAADVGSRLLHVEVVPVMAPGGCEVTAFLAETYLVPAVAGAERLAYVCHTALRDGDLEAMQRAAAARNAALNDTSAPPAAAR